jgi:hypothetical protein
MEAAKKIFWIPKMFSNFLETFIEFEETANLQLHLKMN